jgi:hypothetical protein
LPYPPLARLQIRLGYLIRPFWLSINPGIALDWNKDLTQCAHRALQAALRSAWLNEKRLFFGPGGEWQTHWNWGCAVGKPGAGKETWWFVTEQICKTLVPEKYTTPDNFSRSMSAKRQQTSHRELIDTGNDKRFVRRKEKGLFDEVSDVNYTWDQSARTQFQPILELSLFQYARLTKGAIKEAGETDNTHSLGLWSEGSNTRAAPLAGDGGQFLMIATESFSKLIPGHWILTFAFLAFGRHNKTRLLFWLNPRRTFWNEQAAQWSSNRYKSRSNS